MVEREGALEPVGSDLAGVPVPPDVVDQNIDPGTALEYLLSQPPHLRLGGQVRNEHVHLPAGCSDLAAAPSVRARSRPVIATCAPIVARPRAVALPMPPLLPVTSTALSASGPLGISSTLLRLCVCWDQ